jgi:UDP-2-acetamido-2,6-beta-L-arabino-hexul-4-ose reductase
MNLCNRRILITGANGFIGKNLVIRLKEIADIDVIFFTRGDNPNLLSELVSRADAVVHLAGENRPLDEVSFEQVNFELTRILCDAISQEIRSTGRFIPLVLTSSIQAELTNPYGRSKLAAEGAVEALANETGNPCTIYRLPSVFGKWCKPNYNSVVATFCYNIARELPINISDPAVSLQLVYVDDVVTALLSSLQAVSVGCIQAKVEPEYFVTLGELASKIRDFGDCNTSLMIDRVGAGFFRVLYATYVSYLPNEKFSYKVPQFVDPRGLFVELLKTTDSGQFSYFTAFPGMSRGGHYHHTKTEKFLVIKGEALFRFRQLLTNELVEMRVSGCTPEVVNTIPGWAHEITNVGSNEMIVMLWANENFDREKPDTVASQV